MALSRSVAIARLASSSSSSSPATFSSLPASSSLSSSSPTFASSLGSRSGALTCITDQPRPSLPPSSSRQSAAATLPSQLPTRSPARIDADPCTHSLTTHSDLPSRRAGRTSGATPTQARDWSPTRLPYLYANHHAASPLATHARTRLFSTLGSAALFKTTVGRSNAEESSSFTSSSASAAPSAATEPAAPCEEPGPGSTANFVDGLPLFAQPLPHGSSSSNATSPASDGAAVVASSEQPLLWSRSEVRRANDTRAFAGVRSTRARRDYNEDRLCVAQFGPDTFFFAVFDGHGGSSAADFATAHVHWEVHALMQAGASPSAALVGAFQKVNDDYCASARSSSTSRTAGTTAVVAVVVGRTMYIANVGDSRAILCRSGRSVQMSFDHKPDVPEEQQRIEAQGGEVVHDFGAYRLQGMLTVSRALGDLELQQFGLISTPFVVRHEISMNDAFLVLASDGLHDALAPSLILDIIRGAAGPDEAAVRLTMESEMRDVEDNTTVVVVRLPGWRRFQTDHYAIGSPFGRKLNLPALLSQMDKYMPVEMTQDDIAKELEVFEKTGLGSISRAGFHVFDETQQGYITFAQLEAAMKRLGEDFSKKELREMFDEADLDRDGKIGYEEFCRTLRQQKDDASS
ncbi:hypothetical protein CAOG_02605 [Capsaspora owczarzaki ATCC 30864]|uniref:Protein phosphatase 2C n=1 Tax=Capsaspora owczarzaki (strain ATCC 30864) TaxID=595528 RepID=A0A0D2WLK4_CAPO3|nr:hypothetical protein CAOG_02605 [Capsaspora owczarzaki ATCC 30864]KJE91475.1 hypothetical protein CAOG_002605 [Capsaspora owczarzaki ATCC 30864]|eukprot:XP_004349355.2 hypothetical protein CAOG_02605 [Capsaspora owczarzaki ATCC 30864]